MDELPVVIVKLQRRFSHAFKTGYICGRNGWGKEFNPYKKRNQWYRMWLDGWGVGRAGSYVMLVELDDQAGDIDKRARP